MAVVRMLPLLLLALLCSRSALADTATFGDYTVHYIAVNSTFLNPEVASQYGLQRGARRGFLNIAVLQDTGGASKPVTARISGDKRNLMQQSTALTFQEIHEGDAIYYLAPFDFSNAETLRFTLDVQPTASEGSQHIEWSTQLYAD
ncbi:MAG TPA: DUF4426 domain-containing protein [Hyphomicrobiales bacterium]|nr:DUF4426 domain-containing protein [Hyphomicrobiales bacterium]